MMNQQQQKSLHQLVQLCVDTIPPSHIAEILNLYIRGVYKLPHSADPSKDTMGVFLEKDSFARIEINPTAFTGQSIRVDGPAKITIEYLTEE